MNRTKCEGAKCGGGRSGGAKCGGAGCGGAGCHSAATRVRAAAILLLMSVVSGFSRTVTAQDVAGDLDERIVKLVGAVSEERLGVILKKLESFETRSSLSSTTSTTRGIGAARQWILTEMSSYNPHLKVSFDTYQVPPQGRVTRNA